MAQNTNRIVTGLPARAFPRLLLALVFTLALLATAVPGLAGEAGEADREKSAGEAEAATPRHVLDEMVVTAKRQPQDFMTGDVDLELSPSFYSVITRDRFAGKMEDLAQVIEQEAGVQVRQSGGLGSFSTVSLRGSDSEQVMVFLDGVLLNDGSGGGVDLSNIALADVQDIQIFRGVTPVNFGKASIGGAINIRTLRARKGFKASAGAGYGSFNTRSAFGFINHKPGKGDYLLSADLVSSDNDFKFIYDNETDFNDTDDREVKRHNAGFQQVNVLAKGGWDFTGDFRAEIIEQYFNKDQHLPSRNNSGKTKTTYRTERNIATARFIAENLTALDLNASFRFTHLWKEETYDDREGSIGLGKQHNRYTTVRNGGNLFLEWVTTHNILALDAEMSQESYDPRDLTGYSNPHDSLRNYVSLALQDSVVLFGQRLAITPAIRHTWIDDTLKSGSNLYGWDFEQTSRKDAYWSPQVGVKIAPWPWLTLKSNWARYVREPAFFELFGDRGFFVGNDELKAEKGVNYDAGLEAGWRPGRFLLERAGFSVVAFASDVDDLITRVYDSRGVGKSVNISRAQIRGVETQVKADLLKYFRVTGNATWQDPKNKSEISANNNKRLPGRFERAYLGRGEVHAGGLKVWGEYLYEDGLYYDTPNLLPAEPKKEMNAGVSYLFKKILVTVEGKNLTDRDYEDFNGYPLPGRSVYVTVKYDH